MKKLVLAFLLFAGVCNATEVVVTGYGATFEQALSNAKVVAVDKAVGSWVNGEQSYREGKYSERINSYSGGFVKDYEVISQSSGRVTIRANVSPREKNGMSTNSATVPLSVRKELAQREANQKKLKDSVKVLDNRSKAFGMDVEDIKYESVNNKTLVTIIGTIKYNQKWVSDLKELAAASGTRGMLYTNSPDYVANALVAVVSQASPAAGGVSTVIIASESKPDPVRSEEPMVCVDECFVVGEYFNEFYKDFTVTVVGMSDDKQMFKRSVTFDDHPLYELMLAGQQVNGPWGRKLTYQNPALLIHKNKKMQVRLTFYAESDKLASVTKFDFRFN